MQNFGYINKDFHRISVLFGNPIDEFTFELVPATCTIKYKIDFVVEISSALPKYALIHDNLLLAMQM